MKKNDGNINNCIVKYNKDMVRMEENAYIKTVDLKD